ncbi:hypothetical protein E8E14_011873 [Neopestalotiopsis sp. 37M]|nr:hypothetical protein E8E14_011873 [Neopestalotiopsis sp. 37M]
MDEHTDICIIGAGMSGICTAIQLIRQYKTRNFIILEKAQELGGTWSANTYPGCGCDVPSHFYSFSFALNPNWSQKYAMQPELLAYFKSVCDQYEIEKHVRFGMTVESSEWHEGSRTWLTMAQGRDGEKHLKLRSKILVSAVGGLSIPKPCTIPGASTFNGRLFHSAEWDHSFDWNGKNVVVVGNGCSATQFVPIITDKSRPAKKVVQFANQPHWLAERENPEYSSLFKWTMRNVPLAMRAYRAALYWEKEGGFRSFDIEKGKPYRAVDQAVAEGYIRKNAPAKYVDFLVPKTELGCKRRVNDTEYLQCLHRDNVDLVSDDPIQEIIPTGVRTKSGRTFDADAIVLATGFQTQKVLSPIQIYGQGHESINDHWQRVSDGAPSAYFGTCLAGFPNFFIMMGPNTLSGHLSVIYTTECQVNFMMRCIAPVMSALSTAKGASRAQSKRKLLDTVVVTPEAETRDLAETQAKARRLVWASGCTSWFLDAATGRNTVMFPDWQYKFWIRSFWIPWKDFMFGSSVEA